MSKDIISIWESENRRILSKEEGSLDEIDMFDVFDETAQEPPPQNHPNPDPEPDPYAGVDENEARALPPTSQSVSRENKMEQIRQLRQRVNSGVPRGSQSVQEESGQQIVQVDSETARLTAPPAMVMGKRDGNCLGRVPYDPASDPLAKYGSKSESKSGKVERPVSVPPTPPAPKSEPKRVSPPTKKGLGVWGKLK